MSRDPLDWPFLASSIWNMPIGSGAVYTTTKINGTLTWPLDQPWADMPGYDENHFIMVPTAPATVVKRSTVGWGAGDRCVFTAPETNLITLPIPNDYTVPDSGANGSAAIVASDGITLHEMQPFTRCSVGGYATSIVTMDSYPSGPGSLIGDGNHWGSHGGSFLSAWGSLRVGELRPGGDPPTHVLGINLGGYVALYKGANQAATWRWPAKASDGYWSLYGSTYNNTNSAMKMGALLAIHKDTDINTMGFETDPGLQLAWTFQNYGAYVGDTFPSSWPGFAFWMQRTPDGRFLDQFQSDYPQFQVQGSPYNAWRQPYNTNGTNPWVRDIARIFQNLWVIDNNSATAVGGGGVPRVDYAPLMETA